MDAPLSTLDFKLDVPGAFHAAHGSAPFELEPAVESGTRRGLVGVGGVPRYHTIMMDPPWPIRWQHSDTLGMKQLQYQTLPISEIMQLPIDRLAHEHCLLIMWVTNEFLPEGLGIVRHWKFQYEKLFTWCKNNGMGAHPRNATEHFIIASRGCPPKLRGRNDSAILNWINLPVTKRHSEKPKEIRHIIEKFAPEPRLEMFAREKRPGWDSWGNEFEPAVRIETGGGGAEHGENAHERHEGKVPNAEMSHSAGSGAIKAPKGN